jgi:PAS domain S-box-containing protein
VVFCADRLSWQALCAAVRDAPVAIGVCDEDGRMVAVSRALLKLLRRTQDEIIGRPFLALVCPQDRPVSLTSYFEAVVAAAAGVRTGTTRLRCLTGDHDTMTVEVTWTVTDADETTSACGILYLVPARTGPIATREAGTPVAAPATVSVPAGRSSGSGRRQHLRGGEAAAPASAPCRPSRHPAPAALAAVSPARTRAASAAPLTPEEAAVTALVQFLLERYAEDERDGRELWPGEAHALRRAVHRCERKILDGADTSGASQRALRAFSLRYADHPGYREQWRP